MPFYFSPYEIQMPATQELKDGDTWLLTKPFVYIRANGQRLFIPPSGLGSLEDMAKNPVWTTDYGSIPMAVQNLFRKDGAYAPAYVLHDWLYASEMFDRATCDWILLEALQELGAWWLTRNTVYSAVRCGGGAVWAKHDPLVVAGLKDYQTEFKAALLSKDSPWPELVGWAV